MHAMVVACKHFVTSFDMYIRTFIFFRVPVFAKKKPVGKFALEVVAYPRTPNFNVDLNI